MTTRLKRRIEQLERRLTVEDRQPVIAHRVIVSGVTEPLNLENSTYKQVPWGPGKVMELIHLEGYPNESNEAELEAWIATQAAAVQLQRNTSVRRI